MRRSARRARRRRAGGADAWQRHPPPDGAEADDRRRNHESRHVRSCLWIRIPGQDRPDDPGSVADAVHDPDPACPAASGPGVDLRDRVRVRAADAAEHRADNKPAEDRDGAMPRIRCPRIETARATGRDRAGPCAAGLRPGRLRPAGRKTSPRTARQSPERHRPRSIIPVISRIERPRTLTRNNGSHASRK